MLNSFNRYKIKSSFQSKYSSFNQAKNSDKQVDMLAIYEKLPLESRPKRTPGGWIAKCPFPDHLDNTPSFVMYPDTQSYYCFGCKRSGKASWFEREMGRVYGI